MFGSDSPDLAKFAQKVLSQTCTASCAEQNWAVHDYIHSKKRNRLTKDRVDKLVFVGNNLQLRERESGKLEITGFS